MTDRDRWRRRIASAVLVLGVAAVVWWFSSPRPRAFDPVIWKQASGGADYRRFAMSADLVARAAAEHWSAERVQRDLGTNPRDGDPP